MLEFVKGVLNYLKSISRTSEISSRGDHIKRIEDFGQPNNLEANINDQFIFNNLRGYSSIGFNLTIPSGAVAVFESSYDGINFISARMRSIDTDEYTSMSNETATYIGSISSVRIFRVRISLAGSGTGSVIGRASIDVSTLEGIEHGSRPDAFGNIAVHKDFTYTAIQTGAIIWTPQSNKKFVVTDLFVSTDGNNIITFFDETNSPGNIVYGAKFTTNNGIVICSFRTPYVSISANNSLKLTSTTAQEVRGVIHGYEIS